LFKNQNQNQITINWTHSTMTDTIIGVGRARKDQIHWTSHLEGILINACRDNKVYLRTSDMTMDQKFQLVRAVMIDHDSCRGIVNELSVECLKRKWQRLRKDVVKKYALDTEGSNLSGLADPDDISINEKLILIILKEEEAKKDAKKADDEKKEKRKAAMLTHEAEVLKGSCGPTVPVDHEPKIAANVEEIRKKSRAPMPLQPKKTFMDGWFEMRNNYFEKKLEQERMIMERKLDAEAAGNQNQVIQHQMMTQMMQAVQELTSHVKTCMDEINTLKERDFGTGSATTWSSSSNNSSFCSFGEI